MLTNKSLKEKCEISRHMKKVIANKEASEKFGVSKNSISTSLKNKGKLFSALRET